MTSDNEGMQSCSGLGAASFTPEAIKAATAEVGALLLDEFDLARPDDVPYLRFQVSHIAGRIVDRVLEILDRRPSA